MSPPTGHSAHERRNSLLFWTIVAAIPVSFIASQIVDASRNIVFWDEFDTALDLILRIDAGAGWRELLQRLFAVSNEHRTVTSRLMFAGSYWLTGTVNFHVIGAIGNLFLVGACAMLVMAVGTTERRIRIGVILAFVIFQLEQFENFLWSGASIDHFQVIAFAAAAVAALARNTRPAWLLALVFGVLATFTLAQGTLVWPIGATMLWHGRRWKQLAGWCALGGAALAAFLHGFEFNAAHHIGEMTFMNAGHVARYWLELLGGPVTLGEARFAWGPGLLLLTGLGFLAARGAARREPVAMFTAFFALGALALVAIGRSSLAGAEINSRYLVLGALAWALLLFMLIELRADPVRPFGRLMWLLPALTAFNVAANTKFAPMAEGFIELRDRAATRFKQYGEDGKGISRLHPAEGRAAALLKIAKERGVYNLPRVSEAVVLPAVQPSARIITQVDEMVANDRAVTVGGWAVIPGQLSRRGQVHLVLRSEKSFLIYSTLSLARPDVAKAHDKPNWRLSGFRAVVGRSRLPAEDFQIGVLIVEDDCAEFMMTPNRLLLASGNPTAVRLASGP